MVDTLIEAFPKESRTARDDGSKVLNVAEFFMNTLQGENIMGNPAMFLRLQFCTLNCKWCFHPNAKVSKKNGGQVPIKDIKEGDTLLTLDPKEGKIVETIVQKTMNREVKIKDMISFETEKKGNPIVCTKNHRFYVKNKGWIEASNLKLGDIILNVNGSQRVSYKAITDNATNKISKEKRLELNRMTSERFKGVPKTAKANKLNSDYHKKYNPMKNPEIVKKSAMNRFKKPSNIEVKYMNDFNEKDLPIKYVGNNKLPIGNKNDGYRFPDFVVEGKNKLIEIYDTTYKYLINNIRKRRGQEWLNKTINHYKKFGYDVLFLTELDLKNGYTDKLMSYVFNGKKVTKINDLSENNIIINKKKARLFGNSKIDKTKVYNLSCKPYNTYLINSCLVHNCDTAEVWRKGNPYSTEELLDLMEEKGAVDKLRDGQRLILTGGSPLRQQEALADLLTRFHKRYDFVPFVEVENECTVMPDINFAKFVNVWNNSPKLENSGNKKELRYKPEVIQSIALQENAFFKFVITCEEDWEEIQRDFLDAGLISRHQIVVMPEGATREELQSHYESCVTLACREGVRFSDRLQVTIWDKTTGV